MAVLGLSSALQLVCASDIGDGLTDCCLPTFRSLSTKLLWSLLNRGNQERRGKQWLFGLDRIAADKLVGINGSARDNQSSLWRCA